MTNRNQRFPLSSRDAAAKAGGAVASSARASRRFFDRIDSEFVPL
jgi:hypothetical protein